MAATGKVTRKIARGPSYKTHLFALSAHNVLQHFSLQQVVELNGYVIILVEGRDGKIKLVSWPHPPTHIYL